MYLTFANYISIKNWHCLKQLGFFWVFLLLFFSWNYLICFFGDRNLISWNHVFSCFEFSQSVKWLFQLWELIFEQKIMENFLLSNCLPPFSISALGSNVTFYLFPHEIFTNYFCRMAVSVFDWFLNTNIKLISCCNNFAQNISQKF